MKYVVATRGSALSLAQTRHTLDKLTQAFPADAFELNIIKTRGDQEQDLMEAPLTDPGVFVKELERALLAGEADFAIHSLKDVPSKQPAGLTVAVTPEGEAEGDALVLLKGRGGGGIRGITDLKAGYVIGTSSPRRSLQLQLAYPHLQCRPLRGNIDTRLKARSRGEYHGLVVAEAGLKRLGFSQPRVLFPKEVMTPAPAQGALGIECLESRPELIAKLKVLHHPPTWTRVKAERKVMEILEAGCRLPFGANGELSRDTLALTIFFGNQKTKSWFRQTKAFALHHHLLEEIETWAWELKEKAIQEDILKG